MPYQRERRGTRQMILRCRMHGCRRNFPEGKRCGFCRPSLRMGERTCEYFPAAGENGLPAIRLLNDRIPTIEELQLPPILKQPGR